MLVLRILHEEAFFRIMINRYIFNQATLLNVWNSVAGYKHIPNRWALLYSQTMRRLPGTV
jgi:hypothetical protein